MHGEDVFGPNYYCAFLMDCIERNRQRPFLAYFPMNLIHGPLITLMDVLPTLGSVANITLQHNVDGMDLSHNLLGKPGKDRETFAMAFEGGVYFVRDERFRLHEDGRFYDVSVSSNQTRYNMNVVSDAVPHAFVRRRLQQRLDEFMAIKQTDRSYTVVPFGTGGDNFKNAQDKARIRKRKLNGSR